MTSNTNFSADNIAAALEEARLFHEDRTASAQALAGAAEKARAIVRAIDDATALAPQRETEVFLSMSPPPAQPGIPPSRGKSIASTVAALKRLRDEDSAHAMLREAATALVAQLAARALEAEVREAARDSARKPFAAETRRAQDHARRIAEYPRLAERVVTLLRTDHVIAQLGGQAGSRVPKPKGSYISYEQTFRVPCVIARDDVLTMNLPGFWPHRFGDTTAIERQWRPYDDDVDGVDISIVGPIREIIQKTDQRLIVLSWEIVEGTITRAQSVLLAEFMKAVDALRELIRLDAEIPKEDREARYPDRALIFDPALFPKNWALGLMDRRIALPSINGLAKAAE